ncbi:carbohydrate ABC transporter permease [Halorussus salinisoli]|uniref:carbohydrate ABC transporter permease n=1 Tax=Halorussus salinisoli TaxID=2558242 RepID=UPI0010C17667|nr:sugar ABC transporter permease [Halorussus salinisoli]
MSVTSRIVENLGVEDQYNTVRERAHDLLENQTVLGYGSLFPVMVLFVFIAVFPIAWALAGSLFSINAFNPVWEWTGLSNYVHIFTADGFYWTAVVKSVIFGFGSVALQIVVGIAFALILRRSFRFNAFVRAVVLLPYLVPVIVVGLVFSWMMNPNYGVLNLLPQQLGIFDEPINYLGNADIAMYSLIVAASWKWSIFVVMMTLARLEAIPQGYYDAARVNGANAWQRFRDITLPNLKGMIILVVLLRGIWMFNKFDIIWIMTRGGPSSTTTTLPVYAYKVAFNQWQLGEALAIASTLFFTLVIGALVYFVKFNPEQEVRVE